MTVQIIKHQVKDNEKVNLSVDTRWVNCLCLQLFKIIKDHKSQSCQFIETCLLICTINFVVELNAIYLIN